MCMNQAGTRLQWSLAPIRHGARPRELADCGLNGSLPGIRLHNNRADSSARGAQLSQQPGDLDLHVLRRAYHQLPARDAH
jgi:hypothetical protein